MASWKPPRSKMVPRCAGSATVSCCWPDASLPSDCARTLWSQVARARISTKTRVKAKRRILTRRFAPRAISQSLRAQLDVLGRVGVGGDEPELRARLLLDLLHGGAARKPRLEIRV